MSALADYHEYLESDDEFYYQLRMSYNWDDESFQKMLLLLNRVLSEYKGSDLIPKSLVYFFTSKVDLITGLVTNPLFFKNPPVPFTADTYQALIAERVRTLQDLKRRFFTGEL